MLAANYTTVRNNLKDYCDKASDENEIVIVTRKEEKNVVIMSLDRLNQLEKELRNARYLAKLEKGFAQIEAGKGVAHELIEVDD
ncbi:MAG: type II toxin-antitoxin system prevent-host-death family antitoxin [Oribacterium sp.]|nr:type II toxin-antitoxin system prevent-host-death family antitoxin [Oribacterium sp.]